MIAHTMNAFKQISQLGQIPQVETAMPPRIDRPFPASTRQKANPMPRQQWLNIHANRRDMVSEAGTIQGP